MTVLYLYPCRVQWLGRVLDRDGRVALWSLIDQKYASLINFPIRHAFDFVKLYNILCKLEPLLCFTTCQFMMS